MNLKSRSIRPKGHFWNNLGRDSLFYTKFINSVTMVLKDILKCFPLQAWSH